MNALYQAIYEKYCKNSHTHIDLTEKAAIVKEKFVDVLMNEDTLFNKLMKTNPKYTRERLVNKFIDMGLTDDKKKARTLVTIALQSQYPWDLGHSDDYLFREIESKGEILYQLVKR